MLGWLEVLEGVGRAKRGGLGEMGGSGTEELSEAAGRV